MITAEQFLRMSFEGERVELSDGGSFEGLYADFGWDW